MIPVNKTLSPTLWRTCRALANRRRLRIVQLLLQRPRSAVSDVAKAAGVPVTIASLYLRALNARGILRAQTEGRRVLYRVGADPSLPQAAPLVRALVHDIGTPGEPVERVFAALTAFTHARRIDLIRALADGPLTRAALIRHTRMSPRAATRHLRKLRHRGYVARCPKGFACARPPGALAGTLLDLALAAPPRGSTTPA